MRITWFNGLSISRKILLGFCLIISLYLVMATIGYFQLNKINHIAEDKYPESLQIRDIYDFSIHEESFEREIDKYFLLGYAGHKEKAKKELDFMEESLDSLVQNLNHSGIHYNFNEPVFTITSAMEELKKETDFIFSLKNTSAISNKDMVIIYHKLNEIDESRKDLLSMILKHVQDSALLEIKIISDIRNQFIIIGLMVILIGLILSYVLSSSISKPIHKLSENAIKIGKGNFNVKTNIDSGDEIGQLSKTIDKMTSDLKKSTISIKELEKQVKERTRQLERAKHGLEKEVKERTIELNKAKINLEKQVKERTSELQKKVNELEKFQEVMVNRELKMIQLKKKIRDIS